ncbi:hypothetical protein RB195_012582 [Necator americanus]|uniref:GHMP kinase C-terminal domain-containing protein n=1 Tax=Necator americanus TaxID=51031 RepID=A0ABR1DS05_NECAM
MELSVEANRWNGGLALTHLHTYVGALDSIGAALNALEVPELSQLRDSVGGSGSCVLVTKETARASLTDICEWNQIVQANACHFASMCSSSR